MSGIWLNFGALDYLETAPVALERLLTAEDALGLEGIRVLALRRAQSVGRDCLRLEESATLDNHISWTERYLALLAAFIKQLDKQPQQREQLKSNRAGFRWSSPLSSLPASSHFALDSILCEQIMALYFYAALLQEQAYELASRLLPAVGTGGDAAGAAGSSSSAGGGTSSPERWRSPERGRPAHAAQRKWKYTNACSMSSSNGTLEPPAEGGEAFARIAALYRRAAGVFQHIDTQLYAAAEAEGLPADRPVELWEGAAAAMQALCLAQAQAVAAHRAELKGTSAPLVAALHAGAADLFEAASAKLRGIKQASPELKRSLNDRLRRFLAISATLEQAKAQRALAQDLRGQPELGLAVAGLRSAAASLRQALAVCEKDGDWRAALSPELAALEALHAGCDRERTMVTMQAVASAPPMLPPGKVIVSAVAYETPKEAEEQAYWL